MEKLQDLLDMAESVEISVDSTVNEINQRYGSILLTDTLALDRLLQGTPGRTSQTAVDGANPSQIEAVDPINTQQYQPYSSNRG